MVVGEGRYGRRWPSAGARKILVGRLRARRGEIEEEIFARIRDERFESTGSDDDARGDRGRGLSPSNSEVAAGIGVVHRSQVSRLLSELAKEGLVLKITEGVGRRNARRLTARGEEIARTFGERGM